MDGWLDRQVAEWLVGWMDRFLPSTSKLMRSHSLDEVMSHLYSPPVMLAVCCPRALALGAPIRSLKNRENGETGVRCWMKCGAERKSHESFCWRSPLQPPVECSSCV